MKSDKAARQHIAAHFAITADGKISPRTANSSFSSQGDKALQAVREGGGTLLRALEDADLVDEIFLTITPVVFGGAASLTLTGKPGAFLPEARDFQIVEHRIEGSECLLRLRRKPSGYMSSASARG